jgi:hypothetical protein
VVAAPAELLPALDAEACAQTPRCSAWSGAILRPQRPHASTFPQALAAAAAAEVFERRRMDQNARLWLCHPEHRERHRSRVRRWPAPSPDEAAGLQAPSDNPLQLRRIQGQGGHLPSWLWAEWALRYASTIPALLQPRRPTAITGPAPRTHNRRRSTIQDSYSCSHNPARTAPHSHTAPLLRTAMVRRLPEKLILCWIEDILRNSLTEVTIPSDSDVNGFVLRL